MITYEDWLKFSKKDPGEQLTDFEFDHFDELMRCGEINEENKNFPSTEDFHKAVEATIKDMNNLLS